jgi:putative transposase
VLDETGVAISMDSNGRWFHNVFIERLWNSVKFEEVYLYGYANANATETRTELLGTSAFATYAALTRELESRKANTLRVATSRTGHQVQKSVCHRQENAASTTV